MKIGDALVPSVVDPISTEVIRLWSEFLADPNPIHLDPAAVAALGLGDRVISQGPANMAYAMNLLAANFPGTRIESFHTRFVGNVFAEDRVVAGGKITAIDGDRMTCELWLEADGRGQVLSCIATVRPRDR